MNYNEKDLPISSIELNKGQVAGLPKNPRFIRDERYKALVKSIQDAPEMLHLRELLVYQHGDKYVVIGGNMRLRACKELGMDSVPCKVLPQDTPVEKLREYTIKDNNGFGQDDWDILANEWDAEELTDWGLETFAPFNDDNIDDLFEDANSDSAKGIKIVVILPVDYSEQDADAIRDKIKAAVKENIGVKVQ